MRATASRFLLASFVLPAALATPIANPSGGNDLPPGYSGALRGSETLLGADGNPHDQADIGYVKNPKTLPVQSEDAKLGLYIDITNEDRPQPIRGNSGGSDPGPGE
jgi:hypothetical protein